MNAQQKQLGKEGVGAAPEAGETQPPSGLRRLWETRNDPPPPGFVDAIRVADEAFSDESEPHAFEPDPTCKVCGDPPVAPAHASAAAAAAVPEAGALAVNEGRRNAYRHVLVTVGACLKAADEERARLSSPSGDARPPERKPGFNEAMLPEGWAEREAAQRARPDRYVEGWLAGREAAAVRVVTAWDTDQAKWLAGRVRALPAPSILEEPKSPIVETAASQKEEGETCEMCERPKATLHEWFAALTGPHPAPSTLCPRPSENTAADLECYRLGHERQRAEVARLQTQVTRLAESEGAAVASSITANADALSEKQRADAAEAEVLRLTKEVQEARGPVMGVCDKRSEARPWHAKIHYETTACLNFRQPESGQAVRAAIAEDPEVADGAILYQSLIALLGELAEERDAAEASAKALREALAVARKALDRDKTGLAAGLNQVRGLAGGYRWIADDEWGSYDYTQRTEATLRKEVGVCLSSILTAVAKSLNESGDLASASVQAIDRALAPPTPSAEKLTPGSRE